jgi:LCP family protein required for cell wall assembly
MPEGEKPYRVYRGGRVKGKLPGLPRPARDGKGGPPKRPIPQPRRRRRWATWFAIGLGVFLLFVTGWLLTSYFSFRSGVSAANARLPAGAKSALDHQDGLLLTKGTTILVLGTDHAPTAARAGDEHSDSVMLVHTDPGRHRISYLSIPRDLRVDVPGHGSSKLNAAYQIGGAALAIRTVRKLTGLPINHVVIVDFGSFRDLIDKLGGITVDVKRPIHSNRFDCPFKTQSACRSWTGWRFARGPQHMNGERALIYTRVRENSLNPSDNDITRAERQQQVLQAISSKLASFGTLVQLPFVGGDLLKPLATDLSTGQLLALGWVKFRSGSGNALHCRLGGRPETIDGQSTLVPDELNRAVIAMVTGDSAPQPPPPGSGTFGPGCVQGNRTLGSR